MARPGTDSDLTYYPPRARWYRRPVYAWYWLRGVLHLESIFRPTGINGGQLILSVLIPGFALWVSGRRSLSRVFVAVYVGAFISLVLWYGHLISRAGYGTMITIHASSVFFLLNRSLQTHYEFAMRMCMCVLVLFVIWFGGYRPILGLVQSHWYWPVEVQGRVLVMKPFKSGSELRVGQWILFEIGDRVSGASDGIVLREGLGYSPILATPGDTLRFTTNQFFVNGVSVARREYMPLGGEHVIPEKHWFAWPDVVRGGQGGNLNVVAARLLEAATVPEEEVLGTPYHRWFWRKQLP